ncbi:MAG: hypothetical protein LBS08_02220 [Candidatus Symbiothrix sp.]|nr:hypothetical protein [Candidatus Symbiothrix sp.]
MFILILFSGGFVSANGAVDSLFYAPDEFLKVQPVQYDTLTYDKFKRQKFYNYYEIRQETKSLYRMILDWINDWLSDKYRRTITSQTFDIILWAVGILFILITGVIIYKNKTGLFYVSPKKKIVYSIEDEDIEGQNFDRLIESAVHRERFAEAIRWQYLKTLQVLHEKECIAYEAFKTVNEYAYEIQDSELRSLFRDLSKEFIYFRYGKGVAGKEIFSVFQSESEELIKRIAG